MKTLLKNPSYILSLDENQTIFKNEDILIEDGKISKLGQFLTPPPETEVIDLSNTILMPGLVNAHTHSPMIILRSLADDCSLEEWLNRYIWPAEQNITKEDLSIATQYSILEMLAYGITSFSDMYKNSLTIAKAIIPIGIKANITESITSDEASYNPKTDHSTKENEELIQNYNGFDNGMIKTDTCIQSMWQTCPRQWEYVANLAHDNNIGIHIHLLETNKEEIHCLKKYGKGAVPLLQEAGVLENRVVASHCNFMTEKDRRIVEKKNFTCVHDPQSNYKMCSGFINLKDFIHSGINIALGTDGVCSSNSYDLFETMKFTSLLQKMLTKDPTFLNSPELIKHTIQGGLKSQGRENEAGSIAVGKDADIIALGIGEGMRPCFNVASNLVYSTNASKVRMTMVRGKILYQDGTYFTMDKERIIAKFTECAEKFHTYIR